MDSMKGGGVGLFHFVRTVQWECTSVAELGLRCTGP